jgi:F-type H+-transporting ATPase subunit delta
VESAQELDAAQRQSLMDKVAQATGRTPEPTFVVRPEIIGGVRVTYDNLVIDGSLRGGLDRLRERIVKDLLNQA